ncbi:MAG: dephospho-CoA kinase [Bacteroidetes bacterium]|nr:dephospho-CoA kinase [Bacteroidota bacterium]
MNKRCKINILGVTGPIGSGKSTVCSLFEQRGIPVFHADDIAKDVAVSNPNVRKQIQCLLGQEAFTDTGYLNRQFIAEKIFSDVTLRKQYEAIVHPPTQEEIERQLKSLEPQSVPFVILEAALLYEAHWETMCDYILVVDAPVDVCIQRVCQRDGISQEQVRARMAAQYSSVYKGKKADFIIRNTGSFQDLERSVAFFTQLLLQMKGELKRE